MGIVDLAKETLKLITFKSCPQLPPLSADYLLLLQLCNFFDFYCSFLFVFFSSAGSPSLSPPQLSAMSYPILQANLPPATPQKPLPGAYLQTPAVARNGPMSPPQQQQPSQVLRSPPQIKLPPIAATQNRDLSVQERGARTINEFLYQESRYPDLDSYLSRMFLYFAGPA